MQQQEMSMAVYPLTSNTYACKLSQCPMFSYWLVIWTLTAKNSLDTAKIWFDFIGVNFEVESKY